MYEYGGRFISKPKGDVIQTKGNFVKTNASSKTLGSWVCMDEWLAFSKVLLFLALVLNLINPTFTLLQLFLMVV